MRVEDIERVMSYIADELGRRREPWPDQREDAASVWLAILVKEVGKVAREVLSNSDDVELKAKLVEVGAVVTAWIRAMEIGDCRDTRKGRECAVCGTTFNDPDGPSVCYLHFRCPKCGAGLWDFAVDGGACRCKCGYVAKNDDVERDIVEANRRPE